MGRMNAWGHVLVAITMGTDALWDLLHELAERAGLDGPILHGFEPGRGLPRWCLHPTREPGVELRGDDLQRVLVAGAAYLAKHHLPDYEIWGRD